MAASHSVRSRWGRSSSRMALPKSTKTRRNRASEPTGGSTPRASSTARRWSATPCRRSGTGRSPHPCASASGRRLPEVRKEVRHRGNGRRPHHAVERRRPHGAEQSPDALQGVQPAQGGKVGERASRPFREGRAGCPFPHSVSPASPNTTRWRGTKAAPPRRLDLELETASLAMRRDRARHRPRGGSSPCGGRTRRTSRTWPRRRTGRRSCRGRRRRDAARWRCRPRSPRRRARRKS